MEFILVQETDSTNAYMRRLADSGGVRHGTVVCALSQTAGRGQRGNTWLSPAGVGLYISAFYELNSVPADKQGACAKAWALAAHRYVQDSARNSNARVGIKWPNDILLNGQKVGGMLVENSVRGAFLNECIVGIGINLNQEEFKDDFDTPAISLRMVTGISYDPAEEARKLSVHLDWALASLLSQTHSEINSSYDASLFGINQGVEFEHATSKVFAVLRGVDDDGLAVIETPTGVIRVSHPVYRMLVSPPDSKL